MFLLLYYAWSVLCLREQGGQFACLLTTSGSVMCFGDNTYGQCGTSNSSLSVNAPGRVVLSGVAAISAGLTHVCVLMQVSAGVRCWGRNEWGELGTGDHVDLASPPTRDVIQDVVQLVCSHWRTCVTVASTGGMRCWGANSVRGRSSSRAYCVKIMLSFSPLLYCLCGVLAVW